MSVTVGFLVVLVLVLIGYPVALVAVSVGLLVVDDLMNGTAAPPVTSPFDAKPVESEMKALAEKMVEVRELFKQFEEENTIHGATPEELDELAATMPAPPSRDWDGRDGSTFVVLGKDDPEPFTTDDRTPEEWFNYGYKCGYADGHADGTQGEQFDADTTDAFAVIVGDRDDQPFGEE